MPITAHSIDFHPSSAQTMNQKFLTPTRGQHARKADASAHRNASAARAVEFAPRPLGKKETFA
jgi:hypothetical protein